MKAIGAYFGNTAIEQGAAGLGDATLAAYADGILGASDDSTPGGLTAFNDGSLGDAGGDDGTLSAYADGILGAPGGPADGSLTAFNDGSLGLGGFHATSVPDQDFSFVATRWSNAPMRADRIEALRKQANLWYRSRRMAQDDKVLAHFLFRWYRAPHVGANIYALQSNFAAWRAGKMQASSSGGGSHTETAPSNLRGVGEYFAPAAGMGEYFAADGLGVIAGNVLNLTDPAVVKEVKTAISMVVPAVTTTTAAQAVYNDSYYANGLWDTPATSAWFQAAQVLGTATQTPAASLNVTDGTNMYPNAAGIAAIGAFLTAQLGQPLATNFPRMAAFINSHGTDVAQPYYTVTDKARGDSDSGATMASMTKMGLYGLGAVALIGVVVAVTGRKKRVHANRSHRRARRRRR
jgi:hypothetical protein